MKYHLLFADLGTLKMRGRQYEAVLSDLRAQYRRDEIRRSKDKRTRHLERSAIVKQTGDSP